MTKTIQAEPYEFVFEPEHTALLMIDMQRDFMEPGGFGASLGNDVSLLRSAIEPARKVLEAARKAGCAVLGKGAFWATDLLALLMNRDIRSLIVCGVTTEVCVNTTVREANDRGFECVVVADATGSYFPEFQRVGLEMIKAQGGIFGWVSSSENVVAALS